MRHAEWNGKKGSGFRVQYLRQNDSWLEIPASESDAFTGTV